MNEDRLIDLESKMAFQDIAIEELQKAVFDQQATIEKLEKIIKQLTERIDAAASGNHQVGPGNEKPPHY